jgi:hypothetical protein
VERDVHLNARTYWHHEDRDASPVDWVCELLERLSRSIPMDSVSTVTEPPSEAFLHVFLLHPSDIAQPTIADCGHLVDLSVLAEWPPSGRFYAQVNEAPGAEGDWRPLDEPPPPTTVDEYGGRRRGYYEHYSHLWLVGGAWTADEAEAIEHQANVPRPFFVFGPDGQLRPSHPWDPTGAEVC